MPVMSTATCEKSASPPRSSATMPPIAISALSGGGCSRLRIEPEQPPAGLDLARLGKLHADDAKLAPRDAAAADCRVENAVSMPHDALPRGHHSTAAKTRIWNLDVRLKGAGALEPGLAARAVSANQWERPRA